MAFLLDDIPWQSVSSILEVKVAHSGSDAQHERIAFTQQPGHAERLESFARKFHDTVRAHSFVERQKYRPSADYVIRAKGWDAALGVTDGRALPEADIDRINTTEHDDDDRQRQRKRQRLIIERKLSSEDWSTGPETRSVYPADFLDAYGYDPDQPTEKYRHTKFLWDHVGFDLRQWINHFNTKASWRDLDADQKHCAWLEECHLNDILKLLITDASLTLRTERSEMLTENLFLLAHHPQLDFKPFIMRGLGCCNLWHGFDNVAMLALKLFLFLNLIVSMQEDGSTELTEMLYVSANFSRDDELWYSEDGPRSPTRDIVELLPRPMYMNFLMWKQITEEISLVHEHLAETMVFRKMLFPHRNEQSKLVEIDLLSDRTVLAEHLQTCWKIMVITDMLHRELRKPLNWECHVLSTLSDQFGWLVEDTWVHYMERRRRRPVATSETKDSKLQSLDHDNFGCLSLETDENWPYGIHSA